MIVLISIVFVSLFLHFPLGIELLKYIVLSGLLLFISGIDYYTYIIPDELILLGLILYIPLALAEGQPLLDTMKTSFVNGCSVAIPLLLFVLLADRFTGKETMGGGDIKLFFLVGVYIGSTLTVLTLFLSCVVGLIWFAIQSHVRVVDRFPFGPSIAIGVWISLLYGSKLLAYYCEWML